MRGISGGRGLLWLGVALLLAMLAVSQRLVPHAVAHTLASPAAPGSTEPNLAAGRDGAVYLSWIEPAGDKRNALRFATLNADGTWAAARTVAAGDDWFLNWADFTSLIALNDGTLAAHWLQKSSSAKHDYDVKLRFSSDGGATWGPVSSPHRDGKHAEHGFVSLLPWGERELFAVWLDGREMQGKGVGEMSLRYARLNASGEILQDGMVDAKTCTCCQTALAQTTQGVIAAYRDKSDDGIRDIVLSRLVDGQWQTPAVAFADRWQIDGCPVNGPALDARGSALVMAWFTGADNQPRVQLAFSADDGQHFGPATRLDSGKAALGRLDALLLEDGSALASWMEPVSAEQAAIRFRRVTAAGETGPVMTLATTATARASGFPHMVRQGSGVVFAWVDTGPPSQVRTAWVATDDLAR